MSDPARHPLEGHSSPPSWLLPSGPSTRVPSSPIEAPTWFLRGTRLLPEHPERGEERGTSESRANSEDGG